MEKRKAIYYGQVELIPGIICDGYVLDDESAVMSERGAANLLGMNQMVLNRVKTTGVPKTLKPFINKDLIVKTTSVKVMAHNNPHKGRNIEVYYSSTIEYIMRAYVLALAHRKLQKNQKHIGERCAILQCTLVQTALDAAIKEACGFIPDIQKTAQKHYNNAVELIQEFGFQSSIDEHTATKKDITKFLKVPQSTLNSFLYKHSYEIKPIKLSREIIKSIGSKAKRMNGYHVDDVVKITFGMDTEITAKLKKRMFGNLGTFAKMDSKDEVQWREVLREIFGGFNLYFNHPIGKYRYYVDYFIPELLLCLECNGFSHKYYNQEEEKKREETITQEYVLIRFQPDISPNKLFNGILHAKPGKVIRLYSLQNVGYENF